MHQVVAFNNKDSGHEYSESHKLNITVSGFENGCSLLVENGNMMVAST